MVAPRGMEKLHTFGEIPIFSVQICIFKGIAALLEDSVKALIMPGRFFLKKIKGFSLPIRKIRIPYSIIMQKSASIIVPAIPNMDIMDSTPVSVTRIKIELNAASGINLAIIVVTVRKSSLHASNRSLIILE